MHTQGDRERKQEHSHPLAHSPKSMQSPGMGKAEAKNPELNPELPRGWLEANTRVFWAVLAESSNREQSQDMNPGTVIWDVARPSSVWYAMPMALHIFKQQQLTYMGQTDKPVDIFSPVTTTVLPLHLVTQGLGYVVNFPDSSNKTK